MRVAQNPSFSIALLIVSALCFSPASSFAFNGTGSIPENPQVTLEGTDTLHVKGVVSREAVKGLRSGVGRIIVIATALFGPPL